MSVVVGFSPTPPGEAALDAGIAEAKLRRADLVIVDSVGEGEVVDVSVAPDRVLEEAARRATEAGVRASVLKPLHQHDLADEFLGIALRMNAALIVIGLARPAQTGELMLGSNIRRILMQADSPVLTVC